MALGRSFYAFEAQFRRMSGAEAGIADALFDFTRPVSTAYFWCPPLHEGRTTCGPDEVRSPGRQGVAHLTRMLLS